MERGVDSQTDQVLDLLVCTSLHNNMTSKDLANTFRGTGRKHFRSASAAPSSSGEIQHH